MDSSTGWIVCRNFREIPVPSTDLLPRWAEYGRIRPDDYLVNPRLETCLQAREVPELNAIFRRTSTFARVLDGVLRIVYAHASPAADHNPCDGR